MSNQASTEPEASSRMTGTSASATAEAESHLDQGLRDRVLDALSQVYDPELDEPITQLRFIASCDVSPDGDVDLLLRLPTPQCAPNFAFLMGADSRRVVRAVEGVRNVAVRFEDHYTGDEINSALNDGAGFMGAFPGETEDDDLESLREIFTRKALIGRQGQICEELIDGGTERSELVEMTVAQLPDTPEARRVLELREMLGVPASDDSPAFVTPNGERVAPGQLDRWLRGCAARTGLARGQRGHLPRAVAGSPRPRTRKPRSVRRELRMKAARLHAYHDALKLDSIAEPTIDGPLDVIVKIGAAGLCRTDLHIQEGQWASRSPRSRCPTRPATRTPAGSTRSAPA